MDRSHRAKGVMNRICKLRQKIEAKKADSAKNIDGNGLKNGICFVIII